MATRDPFTSTNNHGRQNEEQQIDQQREELGMSPRHDQADQEQDDHHGNEDSSGSDLVPLPPASPPFCSPLDPTFFPEVTLSFGLYDSSDEDDAVDPNGGEYVDSCQIELHDDTLLCRLDFDDLQEQMGEYASLLEPSAQLLENAHVLLPWVLQGFDAHYRDGAESVTEYFGANVEDEQPHALSSGGRGDMRVGPMAIEQGPWQGLPDTFYGPVVSSCATVSVFLKHGVRVDISLERAVRVVNYEMHCTAAIGSTGNISYVCHPCGRVLQEGADVHMGTGLRLAKISNRGVTFTTLNHGLVYLVDASGTKSTTERFQNLTYDLALRVFNTDPEPDVDSFNQCFQIVAQAKHRTTQNGDSIWTVAGVRMKQTPWGDVQVSRSSGRRVIWTSPAAGTISVTTPLVKVALSYNASKYFSVKTGRKRISASAEGFKVRNGSQRAGFDYRGRLTLL